MKPRSSDLSAPRAAAPEAAPRPTPPAPLLEPSLFYDPPYERPVEDELAWHLVKFLAPVASLDYQAATTTAAGPLWVDFVVEYGAPEARRRVGFEVGPLDEAERDEDRERLRDALVIGSGGLDALFRLRAHDVVHRLFDVLYLVAQTERALFSERGHINLETLASPEARAAEVGPRSQRVQVEAPDDADVDPEGDPFVWPAPEGPAVVVERLARDQPEAWMPRYDEALAHFGVSPDDLWDQWAQSA